MFALDSVDDLVLPARGSTTGRALDSMTRRRTFEACKTLDPDSHEGEARLAILALHEAFARRLPGDPHTIARAIAAPEVGVPIRNAFEERGLLPLAIDRLLVRLGDRPGAIAGEVAVVHGRIALRVDDPLLDRCLGLRSRRGASIEACRQALESLRIAAPGIYDDVERFAVVLVPADAEAVATHAIGVGVVPTVDDSRAVRHAIVRSLVRGKLDALREERHDRASDTPHEVAIADLAARVANASIDQSVDGPDARKPPGSAELVELAPDDSLASVVDEIRRIMRRTPEGV